MKWNNSLGVTLRIEGIPDRKDEDVGSVMDVLDAMSLEPHVTIDNIDRIHRLGVWKQSNSENPEQCW
jgi:hypothetical protein